MSSENKNITILSIVAALLFIFAFLMVIFYAPIEVNMGLVQKVLLLSYERSLGRNAGFFDVGYFWHSLSRP